MPTTDTPTALRIPALSGRTIADLSAGSQRDCALVLHADGTLDVIASLSADPVPDTTLVLRCPARQWADDLVEQHRDDAVERGTTTHLQTLRKLAATTATAELRDEQAELVLAEQRAAERAAARTRVHVLAEPLPSAVVPTPLGLPALTLRPRGRHAAPRSPLTVEAETHALCALLDEFEEAGLLAA